MSARNPLSCPLGHHLTTRFVGDFRCDVCQAESAPKEQSLHCATCDFDKCLGCILPESGSAAVCPKGHPLGKSIVPVDGFMCDRCNAPIPKEASAASCRPCDFDVCASCVFVGQGGERSRQVLGLSQMWAELDGLNRQQLPKSALAYVREQIIPAARAANNHAALLRATIFLAKGTIETEDVGMDVGIAILEKELKEPTFITTPGDVSFLRSMMGELYSRYLDLVRWSINGRTDMGEDAPLPEDMKTWSPAQLERVAFGHYARSLEGAGELAQETTAAFQELLVPSGGTAGLASRIRPNLLDFIGHRALQYFSQENNFLTEPSNRFVLRGKEAFAAAPTFVKAVYASEDTTSRKYRALQIYQQMLAIKVGGVEAARRGGDAGKIDDALLSLIELELLRGEFVRNALKGIPDAEVRGLYGEFLQQLLALARNGSPSATASVLTAIGHHYESVPLAQALPADGDAPAEDAGETKYDIPTALQYYREASVACPTERNPRAVNDALGSIDRITEASLNVNVEKVVAPGVGVLVETTTKAIDSLKYRVVGLTAAQKKEYVEMGNNVYGDELQRKRRDWLLSRAPTVIGSPETTVDLARAASDYTMRRVEFVAPSIARPGNYALLVWKGDGTPETSGKFMVTLFTVSRLATFTASTRPKEKTYATVDRTTGEPLEGVTCDMYTITYQNRGQERKHVGSVKSNGNGMLTLPSAQLPQGTSIALVFSLGDDVLDMGDTYYNGRPYSQGPEMERVQTFYFTDRNIYRPGQTIYFKGLVVSQKTRDVPVIQPRRAMQISFYDANRQVKDTVTLTTNEYGTFEGTFTAPTEGLTGRMRISCGSGSAHFRVEEYKRPRFEVTMSTPAQDVRVGGKAKVEGKAINFSGIPLAGATIKYRVRRTARAPWFWGFWCRVPSWSGRSAEILTDTVTADDQGKFEVVFTAVPDSDLAAEEKPEFDYEVIADVTDITGETQTGRTSLKVGYVALRVDIPLADTMAIADLRRLSIGLTDLNGNPIAASAEVALEPLVAPFPVGASFTDRYWRVPHLIAADKATFKAILPHFAYTDEADPSKWARFGPKFVHTVSCDGATPAPATDLDKGQLVANTYYRVTLKAKDSYGTPITVSRTINVFDSANEVSVSIASAETPSMRFGQSSYRVGELATVRYGRRLRFDGKAQPVLVALSSVTQEGTFEWDRSSSTGGVMVQERAVPVLEADRGYLQAVSAFVAYGRVYVNRKGVPVPWIEKELKIEYLSFRNKLEPGQEEQWQLKIRSADPKAADQLIAAEVVAALYDASLDKLSGNSAHSFSNGIRGLFPTPSPQIDVGGGSGFHAESGSELAPYRNVYRGDTYVDFPQLNWFDFPFRSERPAPILARNMMMRCAAPCVGGFGAAPMAMACAAPMMACADAAPMMEMARAAPMKKMARTAANKEEEEELVAADNAEDGAGDVAAEEAFAPAVRTNLKETVFFMPNLQTDKDGTVTLKFTMGEALTRWRLLAFAHTADLKAGTHSDESIVTQKEVMVTPNPPRFLREGDAMSFAAKVSNMGEGAKEGTATLEILDGVTGAPLNELYGLPGRAEVGFQCGGRGQSAGVSWPLKVPFGGPSIVTWRIVAKSGRTGDGEESALPVVTNRMLVTDTLPMSVRGGQQKEFTLKSLAGVDTNSTTLSHEAYTVEFTSNPAWYAVQALPYMMEFPHECSEQIFSRYYANTLAGHITKKQPQIQKVFEAWKQLNSDALKSNLNKNEELKSALLQETPWVLESQSEEQQKQQIALLFDLNRMSSERSRAVEKLRERQQGDGGFAWFPGGRSSLFITQHIAMGFAHLAHLGVSDIEAADIQVKAQQFCFSEMCREYDRLQELVRSGRAKLEDQHTGHNHLLFLYTESFARLHPQFKLQTSRPEVLEYYTAQSAKYWTSFGLYGQALVALIHHRGGAAGGVAGVSTTAAGEIIKSLRERSISNEEMGTSWKYDSGYAYYQAPIETQSLMVEVFREVANDVAFVDELRLWLLKNKQTKHWKTTKQTSEAVYALLLGGESWLNPTSLVDVNVGGAPLPMRNPEPGTGYVKHRYTKPEVTPAMATIRVTNPNKVVAWGAAYWQYFEALDKIKWFQETPLKIKKEVHTVVVTERGEVLRTLGEGNRLSVGDKVRVRIEIRVDREMSYVHLKDMRASGLEPVNVLSQYKWQDGLGYYESTKDLATHFFMDHLPKGTFVFEYTLVASQKGDFSNGITTMQCMYAPEFTSHSEGIRLAIN